jgi:dipeptidyl-peptidase-3
MGELLINGRGKGDQNFVPNVSKDSLRKIMQYTNIEESLANTIVEGMTTVPPYGLGYPSDTALSNYYPRNRISHDEIAVVGRVLQKHGIEPENTRIRKTTQHGKVIYEVLQAFSEAVALSSKTCSLIRTSV